MTGAFESLNEAETHGLVDGCLEHDRRADALRRAARSRTDRQRIERWQDQNEVIRAAFGGVEREAVPSSLDLRSAPHLQFVTAEPPMVAATLTGPGWRSYGGAVAIVSAGIAVFAALWYSTEPSRRPEARQEAGSTQNASDNDLSRFVKAALADGARVTRAPAEGAALPISTIPDLTRAGFTFIGAETKLGKPLSLVLHYTNAGADHVVVGVTRKADQTPASAHDVSPTVRWNDGDTLYALAGTISADRLKSIAGLLGAHIIEN